jgi:hypothetical protein
MSVTLAFHHEYEWFLQNMDGSRPSFFDTFIQSSLIFPLFFSFTFTHCFSVTRLAISFLCPTCYSQCNGECRLKTSQTCTIFGEQQVNGEQGPNDELQVKASGAVEQVLDVDVVTTGDDSEDGFLQASDDFFYDNGTDQPVEEQVQKQQEVTDEVSCAILYYLYELQKGPTTSVLASPLR